MTDFDPVQQHHVDQRIIRTGQPAPGDFELQYIDGFMLDKLSRNLRHFDQVALATVPLTEAYQLPVEVELDPVIGKQPSSKPKKFTHNG